MKPYCVVIPMQTLAIDNNAKICLQSIFDNFDKSCIYFVIPKSMQTNNIKFFNDYNYIKFDNNYFSNIYDYSRLCTNYKFYEAFSDYEYMLIHQLDAYTIHNNIDYFIRLGYDYYGAPWPVNNKFLQGNIVGNGGYSLRKISTFINVCKQIGEYSISEDQVFCVLHADKIRCCPPKVAYQFAWESPIPQNIGSLPMGLHKFYVTHPALWTKIINKEIN